MTREFRKELRLPACFTERDRQDLRSLTHWAYQHLGYDLEGMDYEDFAGDAMFHQVWIEYEPFLKNSASHPEDWEVLPRHEAEIARDAERSEDPRAKGLRRFDIAEDVLRAYCDPDDPHHRWAMSVAHMRAKEFSDRRGKLIL